MRSLLNSNMSATYLQQTALVVILRSFVPADHAEELLIAYGVGAYDDLSTGSSFMMEMSEAAN